MDPRPNKKLTADIARLMTDIDWTSPNKWLYDALMELLLKSFSVNETKVWEAIKDFTAYTPTAVLTDRSQMSRALTNNALSSLVKCGIVEKIRPYEQDFQCYWRRKLPSPHPHRNFIFFFT